MELRNWDDVDAAIRALTELRSAFSSVTSGAHPPSQLANVYIATVEAAESVMQPMWVDVEWLEHLLSERYWHIRQLRNDSLRPFPLVDAEVRHQVTWLDSLVTDLQTVAAEDAKANLSATRVVPDTNCHLHFRPFTDIDWPKELAASSVRLVVPLATIRELDEHKNRGRHPIGHRAASRLRALHAALDGSGRGPVPIRAGVTLEVVVDPPGHVRHPNTDQELLGRAASLQRRRGGPLVIVTGDLSMRLQAQAQGLRATMLSDELRLPIEPSPDRSA